jgi:DNA-binding protein H-NS
MPTYAELKAKIDTLVAEAEEVRRKERIHVLEDIRAKVKEHGVTPEELFGKAPRPRAKTGPVAPRYRDPKTGATWTGRGREPLWIRGKRRERFEITS